MLVGVDMGQTMGPPAPATLGHVLAATTAVMTWMNSVVNIILLLCSKFNCNH